VNDRFSGVIDFMWMSKKVLNRIKLNIFFSMIYNAIGLTLGVLGLMTPVIAILFQEAGCIPKENRFSGFLPNDLKVFS